MRTSVEILLKNDRLLLSQTGIYDWYWIIFDSKFLLQFLCLIKNIQVKN